MCCELCVCGNLRDSSGGGVLLGFNPMPSTMLREAADNVYARDSIGGAPIYGILPGWFVEQFLDFVKICPQAATWPQAKVENTMAALWVLDPEDLI